MITEFDKRERRRKYISENCESEDESFKHMTQCPICDKRIFDLSDRPDKPTQIRLKCPHCRKVIKIQISSPD